nr:actin cytoskeleton-regulatory complex protein PAN1-like [Lolium perenne]
MAALVKRKSEIATAIEQHALDRLRAATESLSFVAFDESEENRRIHEKIEAMTDVSHPKHELWSNRPKAVAVAKFEHRVEKKFARISTEVPESYAPGRTHEDDKDPDPFRPGNSHVMGSTHTKCSGKILASRPSRARADASGSDDDNFIMLEDRQVLEHVTPLAAEVGVPPAPRVRKAPAPEAGTSDALASKRRKILSSGSPKKRKKNAIPTSSGPALELTSSAPGMRPEAPKDTASSQDAPRKSPAHSGAGKAPSSPRGGTTSSGSAAPKKKHHRAEEDPSSPPEVEDTGASNTGVGSEQTGRPEHLVPPVLEKTSKVPTASPSKTSSAATPPPSPAKGAAAPPPASASKPPPAPSGKKLSRKSANITAEQLSGAVEAAAA